MNDSTVVKEYRRAKLRAAASAIELAITAMEDLINDYDREHTKFSGCHPRQGHASTLRQMQQIHKETGANMTDITALVVSGF